MNYVKLSYIILLLIMYLDIFNVNFMEAITIFGKTNEFLSFLISLI